MTTDQLSPLQHALARSAENGHALAWDPPAIMSRADRWTCSNCGGALLRYGQNIYGSATEGVCPRAVCDDATCPDIATLLIPAKDLRTCAEHGEPYTDVGFIAFAIV